MKESAANAEIIMPGQTPENPLVPVAPAALEIMERAQIDVMIATSKKYPRPEIEKIRERVLSYATVDEETAESCIYTLKRRDRDTGEDKLIQGPSIRLAEIVAVCWQNMRAGSRTTDNDGRKVTAQGICFDMENNVQMFAEVSRRITNKHGHPYSEDMQIVTAQACNSIARRNAVFMVVPFALIKPAYGRILDVATGKASTLPVKRDKIFKRLYSMGVSKERILAVLGKESIESIDLEDIGLLVGLGTAIKDRELTVDEAFAAPAADDEAPRKTIHEKLAARKAARQAAEKEPENERSH